MNLVKVIVNIINDPFTTKFGRLHTVMARLWASIKEYSVFVQVKRRQRSLNEEARAFRNKNKNKNNKNSIFRADSTEATVSGT